jgi:hypothetical protein
MSIDWNGQLVDQLDWHWQHHLRPRLDGVTDEEYFWEPAAGCWSVRRRAEGVASAAHGAGEYVIEYERPEPSPPPVTAIACYDSFEYAETAGEALQQLDEAYAVWVKGVRGLGQDGLAPCGRADGPFAELPMAALVLHISREAIHHGAEICLLRDLYRNRG